jgi:predicted lipid-binding transport protein (Tim44 family)
MSESFAFIDIIFFAMVAAFIAFRLRSVLGRRTGTERRRANPFLTGEQKKAEAQAADNVVKLPDRHASHQGEEAGFGGIADAGLKRGLTDIRLADPHFDLDAFLQGARAAFGMIIEAFANGDRATLRPLLADPVYNSFAGAIDAREAAGERLTTEIVSMRSAEVAEAGMDGPLAKLTVRFVTEQINATRDAEGTVVDGDASQIAELVDLWTFARDTRTDDPNWQLVETRTPD